MPVLAHSLGSVHECVTVLSLFVLVFVLVLVLAVGLVFVLVLAFVLVCVPVLALWLLWLVRCVYNSQLLPPTLGNAAFALASDSAPALVLALAPVLAPVLASALAHAQACAKNIGWSWRLPAQYFARP